MSGGNILIIKNLLNHAAAKFERIARRRVRGNCAKANRRHAQIKKTGNAKLLPQLVLQEVVFCIAEEDNNSD